LTWMWYCIRAELGCCLLGQRPRHPRRGRCRPMSGWEQAQHPASCRHARAPPARCASARARPRRRQLLRPAPVGRQATRSARRGGHPLVTPCPTCMRCGGPGPLADPSCRQRAAEGPACRRLLLWGRVACGLNSGKRTLATTATPHRTAQQLGVRARASLLRTSRCSTADSWADRRRGVSRSQLRGAALG
jgi:hypothetical protein